MHKQNRSSKTGQDNNSPPTVENIRARLDADKQHYITDERIQSMINITKGHFKDTLTMAKTHTEIMAGLRQNMPPGPIDITQFLKRGKSK